MGAKLIVLGNEFEKNLLQNVYLNNTYKLLYAYHSYNCCSLIETYKGFCKTTAVNVSAVFPAEKP